MEATDPREIARLEEKETVLKDLLRNETRPRIVLVTDGDTQFNKGAVDRILMRIITGKDQFRIPYNVLDDRIGGACGRIYPTGKGFMVAYQKYEYAVCLLVLAIIIRSLIGSRRLPSLCLAVCWCVLALLRHSVLKL